MAELSWQDISRIVKMYDEIVREEEENEFEWYMDEDNTGIAYQGLSHESICKEILSRFNNR